jgi:hypothetical protein
MKDACSNGGRVLFIFYHCRQTLSSTTDLYFLLFGQNTTRRSSMKGWRAQKGARPVSNSPLPARRRARPICFTVTNPIDAEFHLARFRELLWLRKSSISPDGEVLHGPFFLGAEQGKGIERHIDRDRPSNLLGFGNMWSR